MNTHRIAIAGMALALAGLLAGCERPPVETVQRGFRGTGMTEVYNPRLLAAREALNAVPEAQPAVPANPDGPKAGQVFQNVKVLTDVGVPEFTRLMVAMTAWVAPQQGCTYCHAGDSMASDCYTCHRGQPVPAKVWSAPASQKQAGRAVGDDLGQNKPSYMTALTSLPYDPLSPFLLQSNDVRVVGGSALQSGNRHSIRQAEYTYGLMMHMSDSLGVNCTYCHNTRSFASWETSSPQRATAWYGIRMARDLNTHYLEPLTATFPPERKGPAGDVAKVNCATCHQGAFKPLYGASMLKDHPELAGPGAVAAK
jgi:photosynthetic reaction center cytochrome c subunit